MAWQDIVGFPVMQDWPTRDNGGGVIHYFCKNKKWPQNIMGSASSLTCSLASADASACFQSLFILTPLVWVVSVFLSVDLLTSSVRQWTGVVSQNRQALALVLFLQSFAHLPHLQPIFIGQKSNAISQHGWSGTSHMIHSTFFFFYIG